MDPSPMSQPLIVEKQVETKTNDTTNDDNENVNNFESQYLTDFEPVDCLGKGGCGVVFEAKNKFDDCTYAIKRIALSNSQDSKERVMREVKALAKLEHPNIVRYFNAWLECPPNGWQEEHDQQWINIPGCSADSLSESAMESSSTIKKELANVNETDNSDSIVFEEIGNNIATMKKEHKRQQQFSLDVNKKPNTPNSEEMFLYIQMQLCQKLSLREWLQQHTSVRNAYEVRNMFKQIVGAMEYVHKQGLIHRDLKPSNIFFAYDNKIKIGDFGLVTAMTDGCDTAHTLAVESGNVSLKNKVHSTCVGTHLYMAPEQMNREDYDYKVDIYSLGIIFFELLTIFSTEMERKETLWNLNNSIFPEYFSDDLEYNLIKMMLDEDPTKRPTILDIKKSVPLRYINRLNLITRHEIDVYFDGKETHVSHRNPFC